MKQMTASEVSRAFSAVLDEAEGGETIVVTRGGRRVARISPAGAATWATLRAALSTWTPPADPEFDRDMRAAVQSTFLDEDAWPSG